MSLLLKYQIQTFGSTWARSQYHILFNTESMLKF